MHDGLLVWVEHEELGLFTRERRFGRDKRGIEGEVKVRQLDRSLMSVHAHTVLRRRRDRWLGEGHFLQLGAGVIVGQNGGERIAELGQLLRAPLTHANGMARPIA